MIVFKRALLSRLQAYSAGLFTAQFRKRTAVQTEEDTEDADANARLHGALHALIVAYNAIHPSSPLSFPDLEGNEGPIEDDEGEESQADSTDIDDRSMKRLRTIIREELANVFHTVVGLLLDA